MLVNFGDYIDGKKDKVADPYIQLLPTTNDSAEAHEDFVKVRLMGVDSTTNQLLLDSFIPSGPPDVRKSEDEDGISGWLRKHNTVLIAVGASLGGVLLILLVALGFSFCRKTNVREKDGKRKWFTGRVSLGGKGSYTKVHERVPSEEKV